MKINSIIRKIISVDEVAQSRVLQALSLCFLISFLITFSGWTGVNFTSKYSTIPCMPHLIENCNAYKSVIPLTSLPFGYSQTTFFVFLFSLICLGAYYLYLKKFEHLFLVLGVLWLYKLYIIFGFGSGNFDYYDLIFIALFLFTKNKLYWLRVFFLILYFLASTIKIHEGWILGTYFTALETGLPLIGDHLTPIATNIVIISQMVFAWFLFKPKNTLPFKLSFGFFLFFHLYSGIIVEYRYIITSIPLLVILFWLPEEVTYKKDKAIFPTFLFITLLLLQSIAIRIPGDQKMTLEGNKYGLYMFEANHQCIATYTTNYLNGSSTREIKQNSDARNRCDPYDYVYNYKYACKKSEVKNISLTFDHSINGHPFYRIVDAQDLCKLIYLPFKHNIWIKSEDEKPQLIGYPVKNFYSVNMSRFGEIKYTEDNHIILPGLERNGVPKLNQIQEFLAKHISSITFIYWIIWGIELLGIIFYFFVKKITFKENNYSETK